MKIAILTIGTRGDVEPYAVLGQALKQRGHQVTLTTAKNFKDLVLSYGIDFLPIEADFQAVLAADEGKKMMKGNPFAIRRNLHQWIYPLITNSLIEYYKLAQKSDLVLYHVKTLADGFADQFPAKMVRASVLPVVEPTSEFANPAFSGLPIPNFLNRLSYRLSGLSIQLLSKPIGAFRASFGLPKKFSIPQVKNIYGISPAFLPVPHDYPQASTFNGFWFSHSTQEISSEITEFIAQGKPPLLLTFGSMPFKSKFDLQTAILELAVKFNTRMIVVKGWGLDNTSRLENNASIKVIQAAPYDKLFPMVKAIIHHGGIGTTAACLRAGKPFMICPILYPIGDQLFWGKLARQKGLAVKPIPISKMTREKFIAGVQALLVDQTLYENALQMKLKIDKENGLQRTVAEIEQAFAVSSLAGAGV